MISKFGISLGEKDGAGHDGVNQGTQAVLLVFGLFNNLIDQFAIGERDFGTRPVSQQLFGEVLR